MASRARIETGDILMLLGWKGAVLLFDAAGKVAGRVDPRQGRMQGCPILPLILS
jgi:hypothetical protein